MQILTTPRTGALAAGMTAAALAFAALASPDADAQTPRAIVSSTASGGMIYAGTPSPDIVKFSRSGSTFVVDDSKPIQANAGCLPTAGDATRVTCTAFKLPDGTFKPFQVFARGGSDRISSTTSTPMIARGEDGDRDVLDGGPGRDQLFGGPGNFDKVDGGPGISPDVLDGGTGANDLVAYADRTLGVNVSLDGVANDGQPGEGDSVASSVEDIGGGKGSDLLSGNAGPNVIAGGLGGDLLTGLRGADVLIGGAGGDILLSNNELFGGALEDGAIDRLDGGTEDDGCGGSGADGDVKEDCEP